MAVDPLQPGATPHWTISIGAEYCGGYKIGEGVTAPVATVHPNPRYTDGPKRAGTHGTVELTGIVETAGRIRSIRVTKPLDPELDEQAIQALQQWRFKPGQKDGVDVRVEVSVEMTFTVR